MKALSLLILFSSLAAAGCAVGPNYQRPPVSTPDRTKSLTSKPLIPQHGHHKRVPELAVHQTVLA